MAIKKTKKKKVVKLTKSDRINSEENNESIKKSVQENENQQAFWFFAIIGIVLAMVLILYFGAESLKSFEFGGADWAIEDYENLRIYHGRFIALSDASVTYNIFLRGDPRKNDVPTKGTFDKFKYGGVISMTPEIDSCRGELSRVVVDLGAFLQRGVGVGYSVFGSTDEIVANESDRRFAQCETISDRTIVIIEIGDSAVIQDENNPYCYTIYVNDCRDISSVERFMVKTIEDFTNAKKALEEKDQWTPKF